MATVGVRELKTHTSEVLRRVREGEAFEVTYRGETIAHLVPAVKDRTLTLKGVLLNPNGSPEEFWNRWERAVKQISEHSSGGMSAVDAVREQRRDL
jgi:prevent-host-death family protein